jgi:hypothetical protein
MEKDSTAVGLVLPVAKRSSLVFIAWVAVIIACIHTTGIVRTLLIVVFYTLSIALYFWAVKLDNAMEHAGETVKYKAKRVFWFLVNIMMAVAIHYFFFWTGNAI